jgi:hypothetical protein
MVVLTIANTPIPPTNASSGMEFLPALPISGREKIESIRIIMKNRIVQGVFLLTTEWQLKKDWRKIGGIIHQENKFKTKKE